MTNLLDFYEDVTSAVDRGGPVDVVFLDFQKAFDKVPHKRLLQKVRVHGVGGKVLAWIEDWFSKGSRELVSMGAILVGSWCRRDRCWGLSYLPFI